MNSLLKDLVSKNISLVPLSVMKVVVWWRSGSIPKNLAPLTNYLSLWDTYAFLSIQETIIKLKGTPAISTHEKIPTARPVIFAMIGLPQNGKTTVAKAFREASGAITFESNVLRAYLQKHKAGVLPSINEVAFGVAQQTIAKGYNVLLDSDFANPIKRRMLEAFADELGANVQYIRVICDKEVFKKRLASPGYEFGKLYHNTVLADMPDNIFGISYDDYVRQRLVICVKGEYQRQEPDNSLVSPPGTIEISSNATKSVMEQAVRIQAFKFMAENAGTGTLRRRFQLLHDQAMV